MAKNIEATDHEIRFTLVHNSAEYQAVIPVAGKHNVYNALASIAAVYQIGIGIEESIKLLSRFKHLHSHLQRFSGKNGSLIIDDSWNNTPPAMEEALNFLKEVSNGKKKIAVLGSFPRIGESEQAQEQYNKMAKKVIESEIDTLIMIDDKAKQIGRLAIKSGMLPENVHYCYTEKAVIKTLKLFLTSDSVILLKFSQIRKKSLYEALKMEILGD